MILNMNLRINLDDNTHTVNCLDIFVRPDVLVFDRGMVLSYWENNNKTDRNLFELPYQIFKVNL